MRTNREMMALARESLQGRWKIAVAGVVIYLITTSAITWLFYYLREVKKYNDVFFIVSFVFEFALSASIMFIFTFFYLNLARKKTVKIDLVFLGVRRFWAVFLAYILIVIYISLWFFLFIIPGVIAAYRYAMAFYILADNPEMGGIDAIRKSAEMMKGHKLKLFFLHCRFAGWGLLSLLTLGIGYFWLLPYFMVSNSQFYMELKSQG